jgi:hypothetical protein
MVLPIYYWKKPKRSQLHYLSSLKFSGNYLTTFINEILEINKIESNKVEVEKHQFQSQTVTDRHSKLFKSSHEKTTIALY